MGSTSRAMDDLDRLAFRLVRTIRQRFPQLREQGFTLADLEETLLPFRDARREMADGGADSWEITVLRLVSGERGYIVTDEDLQSACGHALTLPSPTLALVRSWGTTSLRLGPAALEVGTERVSGAFQAVMAANSELRAIPSFPPTAVVPTPPRSCAVSGCRYCGGRLPEHRKLTFCPHCGLDLSKRQCPACSTSLDIEWRFCVTCGRSADLPEFPAAVRAMASKAS